jgi:hypothetical protein
VRATGPSTLYAGGINLAATFNPELARLLPGLRHEPHSL